jgi:hypothetical protein
MVTVKYIVNIKTGHKYVSYGYFTTYGEAECFQSIMGGSIEEIETIEGDCE